MSVSEEAELLRILKKSFEEGGLDGSAVSALGQEIACILQEYRRGSSNVNILLGDVFSLEKKIEETLAEAGWTEEQNEKERSSIAAKIAALQKDVTLAQNEIDAGQEAIAVNVKDKDEIQSSMRRIEDDMLEKFKNAPRIEDLKDEVSKITSAIQIESSSKEVAVTEVNIRQGELQTVERAYQKLKVMLDAERDDLATFQNESLLRQRKLGLISLKENVEGLLAKIAFTAQDFKQHEQISQTLRNEAQISRQELEKLSRDKLQLRKKTQKTLKANNKWREQLQIMKNSEEELLATAAKIEADEEHLESRLKQDSAIQQSFRSQLNQMEVALKTAEERLAEMQGNCNTLQSACSDLERVLSSYAKSRASLEVDVQRSDGGLEVIQAKLTSLGENAATASGLLRTRVEAVGKLEELLSQASHMVLAADRKVLTLGRQKQKNFVEMHRIQKMSLDAERRLQEEKQEIQVLEVAADERLRQKNAILEAHNSLKLQEAILLAALQEEHEANETLKDKHKKSLVEQSRMECYLRKGADALTVAARSSRKAESRRSMSRITLNRLRLEERQAAEALQLVQATENSYKAEVTRLMTAQKGCSALTKIAQAQVHRLLITVNNAELSAATLSKSYKSFEDSLTRGARFLSGVKGEIEVWRNQEAAIGHLTFASKRPNADFGLDKQVLGLRSQVLTETSKSKELSMLLETTADTSRWRFLGGPVEGFAQTKCKVNVLQEQLDVKKQILEEKGLMLSELDSLAEVLTKQATIALPDELHLYKEMNKAARLQFTVDRQTLALLGEGTMFSTMRLTLGKEYKHLTESTFPPDQVKLEFCRLP